MSIRLSKPVVVITHTRSGGTFLMHCLSAHPNVFCPRGEILLPNRELGFYRSFPDATKNQILTCITSTEFYKIAMCKMTYLQADVEVFEWLEEYMVPVIHLVRRNLVRVVLSQAITGDGACGLIESVPHTYEDVEPAKIMMPVDHMLDQCRNYLGPSIERMQGRLYELGTPVLNLWYSDLVSREGMSAHALPLETVTKVSEFLGVKGRPMTASLKRVNRYPMRVHITNWDEFRAGMIDTEFAWCIEEDELAYPAE